MDRQTDVRYADCFAFPANAVGRLNQRSAKTMVLGMVQDDWPRGRAEKIVQTGAAAHCKGAGTSWILGGQAIFSKLSGSLHTAV